MTVVRLPDSELLLHSPTPLEEADIAALNQVGNIRWISRVNARPILDLTAHRRASPA
jgi:hypothetical protein